MPTSGHCLSSSKFSTAPAARRNVVLESAAIPALIEYYGAKRVEEVLRNEEWLTQERPQVARRHLPQLRASDRSGGPVQSYSSH